MDSLREGILHKVIQAAGFATTLASGTITGHNVALESN